MVEIAIKKKNTNYIERQPPSFNQLIDLHKMLYQTMHLIEYDMSQFVVSFINLATI